MLLSGNWLAILITTLIAFGLPALLHVLLYRSSPAALSNDFLLLGPSGSGKTAFCSLVRNASADSRCSFSATMLTLCLLNRQVEGKSTASPKPARETHTSQSSTYFSATLPPEIKTKSNRYRSVNDPSLSDTSKNPVRYRIRDTPGHGKLRGAQGMAQLSAMCDVKKPKTNARGIIYMLDAATLSETEFLADAAAYLYDVLLHLQHRAATSSKLPNIPVLVAANKTDLFTALPADTVKEKLETEIERHRDSKRRGLLNASANAAADDDEPDVLGGDGGQGQFSFKAFEEDTNVIVDVIGGSVKTDVEASPAAGVQGWEEWIASCL